MGMFYEWTKTELQRLWIKIKNDSIEEGRLRSRHKQEVWKNVMQKEGRTLKFRKRSSLKTKADGQAWLSGDPHKGRSRWSIILLRVKSILIFSEDVMFLFYITSEEHILSGAHTDIHMSPEFIVLSEGKYIHSWGLACSVMTFIYQLLQIT